MGESERMTRAEDRAYLEKLAAESPHLEVRRAAQAGLWAIQRSADGSTPDSSGRS